MRVALVADNGAHALVCTVIDLAFRASSLDGGGGAVRTGNTSPSSLASLGGPPRQRPTHLLVCQALAVHEGHHGEVAKRVRQPSDAVIRYQTMRPLQRLGIGIVHVGRAPTRIPSELVPKDDARHCWQQGGAPAIQPALQETVKVPSKGLPDAGVQGIALPIPDPQPRGRVGKTLRLPLLAKPGTRAWK